MFHSRHFLAIACALYSSPSLGEESPKANALFSFVVEAMRSEDGLLPVFTTTTVAGMRDQIFGEGESSDSDFAATWYQSESNPFSWSSSFGLHTNLDYLRFIQLPSNLEVSYSIRAACPAKPYLETNQYVTQIYGGSVADSLVETFAYYYYLEQAFEISMGANSPLSIERRTEMLSYAENILNMDWQSFSQEETWEALEGFEGVLSEEILDFSDNEFAFQRAESGLPATFVYLEIWECGGYEGESYYIGGSETDAQIMIISDLDYEICRALNFDPWSPEECLAWQPFPDEDFLVAGWFRVMSIEVGNVSGRGSIRPISTAFEGRGWENPLRLPVDAAFVQ